MDRTREAVNTSTAEAPAWGPQLPQALGDGAMQEHERVLWRCAQAVSAAAGDQPWLALVGGTALRHLTWLRRASLDLDFVITGPGAQVGDWVRRVLERTEGVARDTVVLIAEEGLRTELSYASSVTQTTQVLKIDKLDAALRNVDLIGDAITHEGVRTLRPEKVAELKLQTLVGTQPRLRARDIYDSTHLMRRYECALTMEQLTTLGRIADSLFERERQWLELFEDDEVLSRNQFRKVREAFTKTASWRKRLAEHGEKFQPVEQREPGATLAEEGGSVKLMDNRPTRERETIGVTDEPAQAATMLIEAGIAEPEQRNALITTIEQRMREEAVSGEVRKAQEGERKGADADDAQATRAAARAVVIHRGRTGHPDPSVRAHAHVALAAIAPEGEAAQQLAKVLSEDHELASTPTAAKAVREGTEALASPESRRRLRKEAIAAIKTRKVREEFGETIRAGNPCEDQGVEGAKKEHGARRRGPRLHGD